MTLLVLVSVVRGSHWGGWVGHRRNWADAPRYHPVGGHRGGSSRVIGPIATVVRLLQTDG